MKVLLYAVFKDLAADIIVDLDSDIFEKTFAARIGMPVLR